MSADKPNLQIHCDRATLESRAARGDILRFEYGGVVWFERITDDNRHAIKSPDKPKRSHSKRLSGAQENRGRPKGSYRKDIPLSVVKALKERGLSGSEAANELLRLGYGRVSKDYANRVTRGIVESGNVGGRPRKVGEAQSLA